MRRCVACSCVYQNVQMYFCQYNRHSFKRQIEVVTAYLTFVTKYDFEDFYHGSLNMALWQDTEIKRLKSKESLSLSHNVPLTFSHLHEDRKEGNSQSRKRAPIKLHSMPFSMATARQLRKENDSHCLRKTAGHLSASSKTALRVGSDF